ncbi:DUF1566 domain-containing protein [Burkholderia cenocepacia]|nr:DUF1566 domain-containing protein [Burkholderia cenocepacia]RQV63183.1 DUF1566 domain-containing protein [Burkholderia cenocepacia]RQZ91480.1 DUF1566 domain-containing protein [Burkholderia cenocepacia]RRA12162.1 DUF1566 domain-containing protein [Burkholderia cenocepacia]
MKKHQNECRLLRASGIRRATKQAAAKWRAMGTLVLLLAGTTSFASPCFAGSASTLIDNRYLIQGNGATVKDTRTGLTWMRCSVGQKWDGADCRGVPERLTLAEAGKRVADGDDGAGQARWRLPTGDELAGLLLCIHSPEVVQNGCAEARAGNAASEVAFPGMPDCPYWSASTGDGGSPVSVLFDISGSMYGFSDPQDALFVRLVEVER